MEFCVSGEQTTMATGAVTDLRYINNAIGTARKVMQYSTHSSLGGLQATTFAVDMGAKLSNLSTKTSSDMYYAWCVSHSLVFLSPQTAHFVLIVPTMAQVAWLW